MPNKERSTGKGVIEDIKYVYDIVIVPEEIEQYSEHNIFFRSQA